MINELQLASHMRRDHSSQGKLMTQCDQCGEIMSTSKLARHMQKHIPTEERAKLGVQKTGVFPCDLCSKVFSASRHQKKHRKDVHTEKKVPCELCGKVFKTQNCVNQHLLLHGEFRNPQEVPVYRVSQEVCERKKTAGACSP